MAQQTINTGTAPNDHTGDPARTAFDKCNDNFDELYALAAGVSSWKDKVRAATTVAGTLASSFENGDTIDGVTLATGDRILVKNQASPAENGIYVVNASGAPTRAADADSGAELVSAAVMVAEGTTQADTQWICTNNATPTLGTTAITWTQFATSPTPATAAQFRNNTADKLLDTDGVWDAAAPVALTPGTNVSVDLNSGINFTLAMGGNYTLDNPTNAKPGQTGVIEITQDGTGGRTLAYGTNYKFAGGVDPVLSTAAGAVDLLTYWVKSSTIIHCALAKGFA